MSKIDISQIKSADDLITLLQKEYSFHFTIPVDVEKIAKLLNIDIEEYVGFDEIDVVGKIELQKNGKAKIKLIYYKTIMNHVEDLLLLMK